MKKLYFCLLLATAISTNAQTPKLLSPPAGGNKKAMVGERIGITDVTINYDRPGVKGREGKIYGTDVVHEGYKDLSLDAGTATKAPWRAGANENTTIEFTTDVSIEGKKLPAGKYGFFVSWNEKECTVIFNKENKSWGSYFYDEKYDALRINVKPVKLDKSVEWLKYEFVEQTSTGATILLQWEKTGIPFKVEVDLIATQLEAFRTGLKGDNGFSWEANLQAANYCLQKKTALDEGMVWAERAALFGNNFNTKSTYAEFVELKGNKAKADSIMNKALEKAEMTEIHQYGRKLLAQKQVDKALEIFKLNAKKNPKQYTVYVGLARGYSAKGDFKTALQHAKTALPLAPDEQNKKYWAEMIKKLEEGKDINS